MVINSETVKSLSNLLKDFKKESISYLKKGGRTKKLLEKGGKPDIHIKKENRGKFTEYCGGKVTSECISRGKNSESPTIRKRATFAANARKWKHSKGGKLLPVGLSFSERAQLWIEKKD